MTSPDRIAQAYQLELFSNPRRSPEESWKNCWDWDGPVVGGYCDVGELCARQADGGNSIFCYMEQCRVLEALPNDEWLVEIAMGEVDGKPWPKDGARLILSKDDIWPPTRILRGQP